MRSKEEINAVLDLFAVIDDDDLSLGAEGVIDEQKPDSEVKQYLPRRGND